jgi:PAS domain S-box-containing protein
MGASGYIGIRLQDKHGRAIGILNALSRQKLEIPERAREVMNIIAAKAASEIDRKRAVESLRESEEKFRHIFETIWDGILISDTQNSILEASPSFCKMLGYTREELIGINVVDLIHPDYKYTLEEFERQIKKGRVILESADVHKNGSLVPIEVHGSFFNYMGQEAFLGLIRDITERKQAEEEKKKLQTQLQQAQKMESIGTLAGGIAHDFNNILSIIFGYTDLAMMNIENPDELRKDLDEVHKGAFRAKDLVNQILTFSRRTEQEKQPLRMSLIVKEALKLLRSSIPSTIEIKQDIDSQKIVLADSTQLHQIIMNLCTNAYHAMPETGGTLAIALKDMEISEDVIIPGQEIISGEYLQLEVSDTGHGMDEETKEKIFDPYFTTKEVGEGTGLGLAVVHGIVNSHNGYINVYSEPGVGTTFHVYLPVLKEQPVELGPTAPKEPIKGGSERIMFVDDEEKIANIAHEVLTKYGFKVTLCANGAQALQEFEKEPDQYDLVITDMSMPHMNGVELIKKILKLRPHFPVILCSGFSELINKEKADAMGVNYIQKPVVMSELVRTVRKVLNEV